MDNGGAIRIGIGGWDYQPWRGTFYPDRLPRSRELEYASSRLTSIEINATFYRTQKRESFAKWRDATPEAFVFSVKAPRFATHRRMLAEAGDSIKHFFDSGVLELKDKLGPINWQLMGAKRFDAADCEAFLGLLPNSLDGRALRHVVEARHESFRVPEFIRMAREHGVGIVIAGDSRYPQIADLTAPFVYARIMGSREDEELGYPRDLLDLWAERAKAWSLGRAPDGLHYADKARGDGPRDVYLYVISGYKARDPAAAMALIERLE